MNKIFVILYSKFVLNVEKGKQGKRKNEEKGKQIPRYNPLHIIQPAPDIHLSKKLTYKRAVCVLCNCVTVFTCIDRQSVYYDMK